MTAVDWIVVGFAVALGLAGAYKGLIAGALSLAVVVVGAVLGARLAPHLLADGAHSRYTPLVALAGAGVLAVLLEGIGSLAGASVRGRLRFTPLRALDSAGGLALGAATALAVAWVLGAVALQLPGQVELRRSAQRSQVLQRLNEIVPPASVLQALARVDPFPTIAGPIARVEPPDPRVLRVPGVRAARESVVRVLGTACGLRVAGSGWVGGPGRVVTAAHVVAGQTDTSVELPGSTGMLPAVAIGFDARNDIAILRIPGLSMRPLALAEPQAGDPVAILGYPQNGPFTATPGRVGRTTSVLTQDSYGEGPVLRTVTTLRGRVRQGNSGGPAVNARGAVVGTTFAARVGSDGGYAVPTDVVRTALSQASAPVSTGDCAR